MENENTTPRKGSKLADFFYYHKWHLLAAAFVIMVIVVCSVQTCRHTGRDYTLMYAGPKTIGTSTAGKITGKVAEIAASVEGKDKTAELHHYFVSLGTTSGAGGVSGQNLENFDNEILTGQSVILLISPELYRRATESNGGLLPLDSYVAADTDPSVWYDDSHCAVKLSAIGLSSAPGFSELPEDTLLCLRSSVSVTGLFRQKKAQEEHLAYERLFYAMVANRPGEADGK